MRVVYVSSLDARRAALARPRPRARDRGGRGRRPRRRRERDAGGGVPRPRRRGLGRRRCATSSTLRGAAQAWPALAGADVVHTHDRRAGLLARPQARLRGAASVHTLHGVPEELCVRVGRDDDPVPPGVSRARIAWLLHGIVRIEALLTYLGTVIVPSHALAAFLAQHGFPRRRMHVIPYGVELQHVEPRPVARPGRVRDGREPRVPQGNRGPARGGREGRDAAPARDLRRRHGSRRAHGRGGAARAHRALPRLRSRVPLEDPRARRLRPADARRQPAGLDPRGDGERAAGDLHPRRRHPGADRGRRDRLSRRARTTSTAWRRRSRSSRPTPRAARRSAARAPRRPSASSAPRAWRAGCSTSTSRSRSS